MKNNDSKKRGRAYSVLGLALLYGTFISILAFAGGVELDYATFGKSNRTCDVLKRGMPKTHIIKVDVFAAGANKGKVSAIDPVAHKELRVCQGDIIRWYSNEANFVIHFTAKNPMYGRCGVSVDKFLTCEVRHDAVRQKDYPYSVLGTDGPKFGGLDPHIIVD